MTFLLANLYSYKTTFDCKDWFGEPKEQTDPDDPLESKNQLSESLRSDGSDRPSEKPLG